MSDDTEMTPEQMREIELLIVAVTERVKAATAGNEVGVVMSALFSTVLSGAAGTPEAREFILEHLNGLRRAIEAMGRLPPDEAMVAASRADSGVVFMLSDAANETLPPGTTLQ